jgi:hypothetical protein
VGACRCTTVVPSRQRGTTRVMMTRCHYAGVTRVLATLSAMYICLPSLEVSATLLAARPPGHRTLHQAVECSFALQTRDQKRRERRRQFIREGRERGRGELEDGNWRLDGCAAWLQCKQATEPASERVSKWHCNIATVHLSLSPVNSRCPISPLPT